MSNLSDFLPSTGGGAAVGDYALKPLANSANVYTDSNNSNWLKTGHIETDNPDEYPLFPEYSAVKDVVDYTYSTSNMTASNYCKFHYQSFTDKLYWDSGSYSGGLAFYYEMPFNNKNMPTGVSITGTNLNSSLGSKRYESPTIYDGQTHWQLLPSSGTASQTVGPYNLRVNYNASGPDINSFQFKNVVGGDFINGFTYGNETISLSVPSDPNSLGRGYLIHSIAATTDHFYVTLSVIKRDGGYYVFNMQYMFFNNTAGEYLFLHTYKFTKTGEFVSSEPDVWVINNNSNNGYTAVMNLSDLKVSPQFTLKNLNYENRGNNDVLIKPGTFDFSNVGTGFMSYHPAWYINNQGDFIVFDTARFAVDSNINKITFGRGTITPLYARSLTTDITAVQTGDYNGSAVGPYQTSELLNQPIYIKGN